MSPTRPDKYEETLLPDKLLEKIKESYLNIIKAGTHPYLVRYIPEEFRTEEIFLTLFSDSDCNNYGRYSKFIPDTLKTKEFYLKMLRTGNLFLSDIPERIMCFEFYLEALKVVPDLKNVLEIMPDNLKNEGFWLEVVRVGFSLDCVLNHFRSARVCLEAVRNDGMELKYVPEGLKTLEMCIKAVYKNKKEAVKFVPENIKRFTPTLFE